MKADETAIRLAGVCGLYCGNCLMYRASADRDWGLRSDLARRYGHEPEDVRCLGCRARPEDCWSGFCEFKRCVMRREVEFCCECPDFQCKKLKAFFKSSPRRKLARENLKRIKEVGWERWIQEQDRRWRCPTCSHKISFRQTRCTFCGAHLKGAQGKSRSSPFPESPRHLAERP